MTAEVFYRKWRPQTLGEVVGQEPVTRTLRNALSSGRLSHAYLFCGPRGTGKTSTGRILARAVNCLTDGKGEPCNACDMCQAVAGGRALDIIEIDAASNRGIDEIRELRERVNYAPSQARYKVYIIDEVHMLTKEAANALLKTLEEPPPQVIFILATTEAHKVLPTILSRCQRFDFRRLSQADVIAKLARICEAEGIHIEEGALRLIAASATGSLRDAENILEQLTIYYGADIGLHQVQAVLGVTGDRRARELIKHIISSDVSAGIATINGVNSDGLDLRQFNREVVEYLRGLLLMKTGSDEAVDLVPEDKAELKELAAGASLPQVIRAVKLFSEAEMDGYSTLPLELALVECILAGETASSPPWPEKTSGATPLVADATNLRPSAAKTPPAKTQPPAAKRGPVPGPEPAAALSSEVEQLRVDWKRLIEQAPPDTQRSPAIAILRSAGVKPVSIGDGEVVLSFRYPVHKEQMEKINNQQIAERILSHFLGRSCRVRCVYEPEDNHLVEAAKKIGAQITHVEEI